MFNSKAFRRVEVVSYGPGTNAYAIQVHFIYVFFIYCCIIFFEEKAIETRTKHGTLVEIFFPLKKTLIFLLIFMSKDYVKRKILMKSGENLISLRFKFL